MKIIRERRTETVTSHTLHFQERGSCHGTGYGFPCDERGTVDRDALSLTALINLTRLRAELASLYLSPVIERREHVAHHPAVGRCACRAKVELAGFTNTCDRCGRDYNSAGQELAPRECWGEETGEHWSDIVRVR